MEQLLLLASLLLAMVALVLLLRRRPLAPFDDDRILSLQRAQQHQARQISELWRRVAELNYKLEEVSRRLAELDRKISDQKARLDTVSSVTMRAYTSILKKVEALAPYAEVERILGLHPELPPGRTLVIDGSNVARLAPNSAPSVRNLQLAVEWARERGLHPLILIEKWTYDHLDAKDAAKMLRRSGLLHVLPPHIEADMVILELAERLDALILSNDTFSEFKNRYPRIDARRYSFFIHEGKLQAFEPKNQTHEQL